MSLENNYRCGVYLRISRDESGEHRHSIETQKKVIDKYCTDNNLEIIDYYIDKGISGTTFERESLIRMFNDIDNKQIDTVIVKDLSRIGRNYLKVGELLEEKFIGTVRFISITERIDTSYGYDDTIPFRNLVNEYYCKDLSKKVKSSLKNKAKKERISSIQGGFYGYKYKSGSFDLEIDEEPSNIIKLIYEMHLEGKTTKEITASINKLNTPTPGFLRYTYYKDKSGYIEGVKGSKYVWDSRMIRDILNNKDYTGNTTQYKTTTVKGKNMYIPQELQAYVPNTHPAIISLTTFNKSQTLLKHIKYNAKDECVINNSLAGLVVNDSLHKMTYNKKHNGEYEYRARIGNRYGIDAKDLHEVVLAEIELLIKESSNKEEFEQRYIDNNTNQKNDEKVIKRIAELEEKGSKLYISKSSKRINEDKYKLEMKAISDELLILEEQRKEIDVRKIKEANNKKNMQLFIKLISDSVKTDLFDFTKKIIDRIEVILNEDKSFTINIKYKFIS